MTVTSESPLDTVWRQLNEVRATYVYACVGIRVTPMAIRGSVAAMPVSPERERLLRPRVDPNLAEGSAGLYEILTHPEDWNELRRSQRILPYVGMDQEITTLWGLPVEIEEPK